METIFSIKAHEWTQESIERAKEKKYLQAWLNTAPARVYHLANTVTNICMIPFSLIQIAFGYIETIYTWQYETKNLTNAINNLYDYTNNSVNSFVGIISPTLEKSIHQENNLKPLLWISVHLFMTALLILSISHIDKIKLNYNFMKQTWEPSIYWDLSKRSF